MTENNAAPVAPPAQIKPNRKHRRRVAALARRANRRVKRLEILRGVK